jgi:hypothetical protein
VAINKSPRSTKKKHIGSSASKRDAKSSEARKVSEGSEINSLKAKKEVVPTGSLNHSGGEKSITLGELLLAILLVGGMFLFGYRKAVSIKNTAEDSAKYYKSEAMAAELDLYFNQKGQYPLESNIQDEGWLKLNPRLEVLYDDGYGNDIGSDMFKYTTYPEKCNNDTIICDGYKIDIYSTSDDQIIQQVGGTGTANSANSGVDSDSEESTPSTDSESGE